MSSYHEEIHQNLVAADVESEAKVDAQATRGKAVESDSIQHHAQAEQQNHATDVDCCHNETNGCHCL